MVCRARVGHGRKTQIPILPPLLLGITGPPPAPLPVYWQSPLDGSSRCTRFHALFVNSEAAWVLYAIKRKICVLPTLVPYFTCAWLKYYLAQSRVYTYRENSGGMGKINVPWEIWKSHIRWILTDWLGVQVATAVVELVREPRAPNKANLTIVRQITKFDMIVFYKILINILV